MTPDCFAIDSARTAKAIYLSLSEIAALSWQAIRGAGRNWGEAEEGADAACWLARAGLDWATALSGLLAAPANSMTCPLRAGMILADFAELPEGVGRGERLLHYIQYPVFLLPFAARAATLSGKALQLEWKGASATLVPDAAPVLAGAINATGPLSVRIGPSRAHEPDPVPWPQGHFGALGERQYATLTALMLRFTVPSSAASLAGAGATGDDND